MLRWLAAVSGVYGSQALVHVWVISVGWDCWFEVGTFDVVCLG